MLAIACFAGGAPAADRPAAPAYGPPSPRPGTAPQSEPLAPNAFDIVPYREPDDLLEANGVRIADGGARREIASNMELALEPARGLVDPRGEKKKPMRLLVRVGASF